MLHQNLALDRGCVLRDDISPSNTPLDTPDPSDDDDKDDSDDESSRLGTEIF